MNLLFIATLPFVVAAAAAAKWNPCSCVKSDAHRSIYLEKPQNGWIGSERERVFFLSLGVQSD